MHCGGDGGVQTPFNSLVLEMVALSRALVVSSTAAMIAGEEREIIGVKARQFVLEFSCVVSQYIRPEELNFESKQIVVGCHAWMPDPDLAGRNHFDVN